MKSYGLDLQHSGVNANADQVISGPDFPPTPLIGSIFLLTQKVGDNDVGHYTYNGSTWVTGDISSVIAGEGLLGGGVNGNVSLSLDTSFVSSLISDTVGASRYRTKFVTGAPVSGQYASIKAAIDSITDSSNMNPYVVRVAPGYYYEDEIATKQGIYIVGDNEYAVHVFPNTPAQHLFTLAGGSHLVNLSLHNTGPGYAAVAAWNNVGSVLLHKVSTYDCDTGIWQKADSHNSTIYLEYSDSSGGNTSFKSESANGFVAYSNLENYYSYANDDEVNPQYGIFLTGSGTEMNMQAFGMEGVNGTGCAVHVQDGARADIKAGAAFGWENAVHVANTGVASTANMIAIDLHNNIGFDLLVEHPNAVGSMNGTANRTQVFVVSSASFTVSYSDPINNGFITTGGLYIGSDHESVVDVTSLITNGMQLGVMEGGKLLRGAGLNILVPAGNGYARINNKLKRVFWSDITVPVPANAAFYVYIDSTGTAQLSPALPDSIANIVLGRFLSNATSVLLLTDDGSLDIETFNPNLDKLLRFGVGVVFASGCIVSENATTPRAIDVTAGHYFYSSKERITAGQAPVPGFIMCHHLAGAINLANMLQVDNTSYDDGVNLSPLTTGYYNKHVLYTCGDGDLVKFKFAFGTGNYAGLEEAIAAPLTNLLIPSDGSPPLAAVIVQQGNNNIVQIIDIRPRVGFAAHSTSSANSHGDLLGLANDDHTQYLLTDGSRSMLGPLDMANHELTNVASVNGLDFTTHASRHLPNGVDPIVTAAPIANLSSSTTNTIGIANSLARSDHSHAITFPAPPVSSVNAKTGAVVLSTTDVAEGTNKYYTDVRAAAAAPVQSVAGRTGAIVLTSSDVTEGTNKYFTDARARASITTTASFGFNATSGLLSLQSNIGQLMSGNVGLASGTTTIFLDNTTPSITEGTQLWTATIIPSSNSSKFLIDFSCVTSVSSNNRSVTLALFRNNTLIGWTSAWQDAGSPKSATIKLLDAPGTTAGVTYSLRAGISSSGNTWYIGRSSSATMGNVNNAAWSILEIL